MFKGPDNQYSSYSSTWAIQKKLKPEIYSCSLHLQKPLNFQVKAWLEEGKEVHLGEWKAADVEILHTFQLLTVKPFVYLVLQGLDLTVSCVEDMNEWLGIFNVKLRHMREDIELLGNIQIEIRNKKLGMQSVNNSSLIAMFKEMPLVGCVDRIGMQLVEYSGVNYKNPNEKT
ncbi:hypothetical protein Ancab_029105 [Ancistrocladus abbreviatus]